MNSLLRKLSSSNNFQNYKSNLGLDLTKLEKRIHKSNYIEIQLNPIKRKLTFDFTPNERLNMDKQFIKQKRLNKLRQLLNKFLFMRKKQKKSKY